MTELTEDQRFAIHSGVPSFAELREIVTIYLEAEPPDLGGLVQTLGTAAVLTSLRGEASDIDVLRGRFDRLVQSMGDETDTDVVASEIIGGLVGVLGSSATAALLRANTEKWAERNRLMEAELEAHAIRLGVSVDQLPVEVSSPIMAHYIGVPAFFVHLGLTEQYEKLKSLQGPAKIT